MPLSLYYVDWTYWVFIIPCLIVSAVSSIKVNSAYSKYSRVLNSRGITGADAARWVLRKNGVAAAGIVPVAGKLSDHFDPRTNVIRLSEGVYGAATVAAVGIAAHEAGHAVQHAQGYIPNKIRGALVPAANIGSALGWILVVAGLVLPVQYSIVLNIGLVFYGISVLFTVVTLPVEFNASARALRCIRETHLLHEDEYDGVKKILRAAAMTYVAATLTSVLQLLRLLLLANRRKQ